MSGIETVILNNGAKEAKPLVDITHLSLRTLITDNPIAFYELVMKCRDNNHELFWKTWELLKEMSFLDVNGNIHDSIRNIVLSATEGEWMDMKLINPIKKAAEEIKETLEKVPELEDTNFKIIDITNRKEITDPNWVKIKVNPEGDIREYLEGDYKWEQLFTHQAALREVDKAGKKMPASFVVYWDLLKRKYNWQYENFLKWEHIKLCGFRNDPGEFLYIGTGEDLWCEDGSCFHQIRGWIGATRRYPETYGLPVRCIKE